MFKQLGIAAAVVVAVVVAIGVMLGAAYRQGEAHDKQRSDLVIAKMISDAAQAEADAQQKQREEEQRRTDELEKVKQDAQREIDSYAADADGARSALAGLQQRLAKLASTASAAGKSAASAQRGEGKQGADTEAVLAGMLQRYAEDLTAVSGYADRLRAAGVACERSYDALSVAK